MIEHGALGAREAVSLAASLAGRSDHPVSRAIAEAAVEGGARFRTVDDFSVVAGRGVTGVIKKTRWSLGNHRMIEEQRRCFQALKDIIFFWSGRGKRCHLDWGNRRPGAFRRGGYD